MKNMTFNCNDVIFKQGDFAETMYDVVSGKVGVYADFQTDKEQLLACFGPGETFGEMGMLEVYPRSATAVALEDGTVIAEIAEPELTEYFQNAPEHMITYLTLNMSWVYAMVDMLHTAFGLGMEVVCLPFGATNPRYADAIENYGISILFTSMSILDTWNKMMPDIDMSKVKVVFMGGAYVSPEFKKSFNDYLRSCGSTARIINGYGLSELGGACILSPSDRDDDAIGFLLPGFKAKIHDEDEDRF